MDVDVLGVERNDRRSRMIDGDPRPHRKQSHGRTMHGLFSAPRNETTA